MVDTHPLVWYVAGDARLSSKARAILDDPGSGNRLAVPTIVLAEAWDLARKKRVTVSFSQVVRVVRASRALIWPLDLTVINQLPGQIREIHDGIIVATALDLQVSYTLVSIVTRDANIKSMGLVTCVW